MHNPDIRGFAYHWEHQNRTGLVSVHQALLGLQWKIREISSHCDCLVTRWQAPCQWGQKHSLSNLITVLYHSSICSEEPQTHLIKWQLTEGALGGRGWGKMIISMPMNEHTSSWEIKLNSERIRKESFWGKVFFLSGSWGQLSLLSQCDSQLSRPTDFHCTRLNKLLKHFELYSIAKWGYNLELFNLHSIE